MWDWAPNTFQGIFIADQLIQLDQAEPVVFAHFTNMTETIAFLLFNFASMQDCLFQKQKRSVEGHWILSSLSYDVSVNRKTINFQKFNCDPVHTVYDVVIKPYRTW